MANPGDNMPDRHSNDDENPRAEELTSSNPDDLTKLLAQSTLDESHLLHFLERKELPGSVLEEVGRHRDWLRSYRVRRALAFHPRVPRTLALRLLRDLHLVDLVKLSLAPVVVADVRHLAEDQILSRLGQVSLGEKIALAKRASARVLAALVAEGVPRLYAPALRNPRLTEAQALRLLANERLHERVITAIGTHPRWETLPNIRLALLRHPQTPQELAVEMLPRVTLADLKSLMGVKTIPARLRRAIESEAQKRGRISQEKV